MSQKTNPTSLRLQKSSQNFAFPLFTDCFWSETYQACFESQDYLTSFLKQTSFSKAFLLARIFYRKFSVSVFIQDNRVTRKEKLLFFKKSLSRIIERKSDLSKKDKTKYKGFYIEGQKGQTFSESVNTLWCIEDASLPVSPPASPTVIPSAQSPMKRGEKNFVSSASINNLQNQVTTGVSCKDFGLVKQLVRNDYLKAKQGFFKNMSNVVSISTKKPKQSTFEENIKPLFRQKTYKTETFWPKQLSPKLPKIFSRPCFSFCENVISVPFRQKKNISVYNTLFLNKKSLPIATPPNASLHQFIQKNIKFAQNFQEQQKKHEVLNSVDILSQVQSIQKKKIDFSAYHSTSKNRFFPTNITIEPIRFVRDYQNVTSLVDQVIALLEKRISFRQIKSLIFKDLLHCPQIKGMRISCSGRLGGRSKKAQKAKVQSDSCGATTLAAFSENILFTSKSASTSYGKVGVKIWLSFADKRCAQLEFRS